MRVSCVRSIAFTGSGRSAITSTWASLCMRGLFIKWLGRLEPGDVLVVTRLDRLARSTRDLLNVIAAIADRGAGFKSLKHDAIAHLVAAFHQGLNETGYVEGHSGDGKS